MKLFAFQASCVAILCLVVQSTDGCAHFDRRESEWDSALQYVGWTLAEATGIWTGIGLEGPIEKCRCRLVLRKDGSGSCLLYYADGGVLPDTRFTLRWRMENGVPCGTMVELDEGDPYAVTFYLERRGTQTRFFMYGEGSDIGECARIERALSDEYESE